MTERAPTAAEHEALRARLAALSAASLRISASLDLETVLTEVVESARTLTGARFGAIATIDETGTPRSAPCAISCAAEKDRVPKGRAVMATCGLAGGTQMATRDPSPNRAARIGCGKRAGPRRGARDTDADDDEERAEESVKHRAARRCPSLPRRLEPQPRGRCHPQGRSAA